MTPPEELPSSIIKRIPIRMGFDDSYFSNQFQGIPKDGYTHLFENMLADVDVELGVNYFSNRKELDQIARKIVFTGKIDEFYDYRFGDLDYRALRFDHQILDTKDFQGNSVVNYADKNIPYTRIIEHKHFNFGTQDKSVVTYEYPVEYTKESTPYYPINNEKNNKIYQTYRNLSKQQNNIVFGGRLAEYKYYDMHQVVGSALSKVKKEL
jgi:UDP-galactopyranose mutase